MRRAFCSIAEMDRPKIFIRSASEFFEYMLSRFSNSACVQRIFGLVLMAMRG